MIVAFAATLLGPSAIPAKPLPAKPICQENALHPATGAPRAGAHTLDQERPVRQVYTVLHTESGCSKPVYVNQRVIGNSGQ